MSNKNSELAINRVISNSEALTSEEVEKFEVDGLKPKAVVIPKSMEEVAEILKRANDEGISIIPWGGGTMMSLGNIPKRVDIILLLKRLNKIIEYLPEELVVTAEGGIILDELQKVLVNKGQFLPLDPPYSSLATLGGVVASNSFGPIRHLYGGVRDLLLGIKVANSDGTLTKFGGKVVKNVAGYDIKKLYIGSIGTLGVITQVTFKLAPLPEFEESFLAVFNSINDFVKAYKEVLMVSHSSIGIGPSAIEGFDPNSCEILNSLNISKGYLLALKVLSITKDSMRRRISELLEIVKKHDSITAFSINGSEHESLWKKIQEYPNLSSNKFSIRCKISTLISKVGDVMDFTQKISEKYALQYSITAHLGLGILYTYFNSENPYELVKAIEELRAYVLSIGSASSLVVECAPLSVKEKVDVWGPIRKDFFLMKAIKDRFDPKGILNPGRFIGGI